MTVRYRIALTLFATGLLTALWVIATVAVAFQRIDREASYDRADMFLGRMVSMYDNLLVLHELQPGELRQLLKNLLLFEQDTQLYLLDLQGRVLAHTGEARLAPDFRVSMQPVRQAAQAASEGVRSAYVMGDDPERMDADAVVAARSLTVPGAAKNEVAGYLYLVCNKAALPAGRAEIFRSAFVGPALAAIAGVVTLTTLLAVWIIAAVTRPLRRLSAEVARASRDGLSAASVGGAELALAGGEALAPSGSKDEFVQLRAGFRTMLSTLRQQWDSLQQLDHFRREGVSNLSHDLRSPLTATVACLETLEQRCQRDASGEEDRRLIEIALRNTRNAAQMVRSLGDLALLDEPAFQLHAELLNVSEVLDDIALRFTERAARQGVSLRCEHQAGLREAPPFAAIDVELFERAVANLIDNALKFTPDGGEVLLLIGVSGLASETGSAGLVNVTVQDNGSGIAAQDIDHLFDRLYQRRDAAPVTGEGGKGLGLAIVKRIVELHRGAVQVSSQPGQGSKVTISLPRGSA